MTLNPKPYSWFVFKLKILDIYVNRPLYKPIKGLPLWPGSDKSPCDNTNIMDPHNPGL